MTNGFFAILDESTASMDTASVSWRLVYDPLHFKMVYVL